MQVLGLEEIRRRVNFAEAIERMREALLAQSAGECDTPMPMHLDVPSAGAEVHMKASYRRGARHFALKVAGSFPRNRERGASPSTGMMMLFLAETGDPVVMLQDGGFLTDVRTAAVTAMTARALGCREATLGIIGAGVQAGLQARLMAEVLPLETIWIWSRNAEHAAGCARELQETMGGIAVQLAESPARVAAECRAIVTATSARAPLLRAADIQLGSRIFAVGSDGAGKQELDPAILEGAGLILVDSLQQCRKLGELQHAQGEAERAVEIGAFCAHPGIPRGTVVCDFTGLGVEDLFIAEAIWGDSQ